MDMADTGGGTLDALPLTTVLQTERGTFQVEQGMAVLGSDGERVGVLRDVRPAEADILVHRALLQRDVYIPWEAIAGVREGRSCSRCQRRRSRSRAGRIRRSSPFPTCSGGLAVSVRGHAVVFGSAAPNITCQA